MSDGERHDAKRKTGGKKIPQIPARPRPTASPRRTKTIYTDTHTRPKRTAIVYKSGERWNMEFYHLPLILRPRHSIPLSGWNMSASKRKKKQRGNERIDIVRAQVATRAAATNDWSREKAKKKKSIWGLCVWLGPHVVIACTATMCLAKVFYFSNKQRKMCVEAVATRWIALRMMRKKRKTKKILSFATASNSTNIHNTRDTRSISSSTQKMSE